MEERLYHADAYETRFEAQVERAWRDEDGTTRVVLTATLFYPTSGGQMHDEGTLGGAPVIDVVEHEGRVVHVVRDLHPPRPNTVLAGVIDETRRRHHRQQHTGQHLLSRVIEDRLGLTTVSSRLGESGNTLDVEIERLSLKDLDRVEDEANRVVGEGRPVHVRFLSASEARRAGLRKIPAREGRLRVVEIEGHDRSACGGTHVRNTAEIGLIAVTRVERVQGGHRIHFLCGDRAVDHRRSRDRLVFRLGAALTTGADQLEETVSRLREEVAFSRRRVAALERELLLGRVEGWIARADTLECGKGPVRLVVQTLANELAPAAGDAVQALMGTEAVLALLFVRGPDRTQVLLGRHASVGLDCAALLREVLQGVGGKGGGQPHYARGSFPGDDSHAVQLAVRRAVLSRRQSS